MSMIESRIHLPDYNGSDLLQEKPIIKEVPIDNYLIKILGEPSDFVIGHILVLIQKCADNGHGYIDKLGKKCEISKDEAMNILNDIGKWETFVSTTQNVLKDLGFDYIHITKYKRINIKEFEYLNKGSNNIHHFFQIRKNRKDYTVTEENITVYDVIKMFENINKWREIQLIKDSLLTT